MPEKFFSEAPKKDIKFDLSDEGGTAHDEYTTDEVDMKEDESEEEEPTQQMNAEELKRITDQAADEDSEVELHEEDLEPVNDNGEQKKAA